VTESEGPEDARPKAVEYRREMYAMNEVPLADAPAVDDVVVRHDGVDYARYLVAVQRGQSGEKYARRCLYWPRCRTDAQYQQRKVWALVAYPDRAAAYLAAPEAIRASRSQ
jgi:hypothetical protein